MVVRVSDETLDADQLIDHGSLEPCLAEIRGKTRSRRGTAVFPGDAERMADTIPRRRPRRREGKNPGQEHPCFGPSAEPDLGETRCQVTIVPVHSDRQCARPNG